ncbi:MAG: alpha-E domain-containing protein [Sphingopyxis sp.]
MLSRTADSLYWLARYTERADAAGRLLMMGQRLAMLPDGPGGEGWRSVLRVTGCDALAAPDTQVSESDAVAILLLDPDNPSSIRASLARARSNGRAVRTALTSEMWEALNDGWRRLERTTLDRAVRELPALIDWVRAYVGRFRGAVSTSMLRNEGHDFLSIGSAIERAEITLRLLDVNYQLLLPDGDGAGGHKDHFRWNALLQTLSGMRAYYHVYRENVRPWHIADFLLTSRIFPRSLAYSIGEIRYHLNRLGHAHGLSQPVHRSVEMLDDRLARMGDGAIFQYGLHEFVTESLDELHGIAREIGEAYHF